MWITNLSIRTKSAIDSPAMLMKKPLRVTPALLRFAPQLSNCRQHPVRRPDTWLRPGRAQRCRLISKTLAADANIRRCDRERHRRAPADPSLQPAAVYTGPRPCKATYVRQQPDRSLARSPASHAVLAMLSR
jgi:hypothetical protein